MSTNLSGDTLIQILLALILLAQAGKAAFWFVGRRDKEDTQLEREAKEQTRRAIEALLKQSGEIMQAVKETRAISSESRDLVRGLEKTHLISAETDRQMMVVLQKLEASFSGLASAIIELVGEMRAERRVGK